MRRRRQEKRILSTDARFKSRHVQRFIHMVMREGKKSLAERIVYGAMTKSAEKLKSSNPLEVFQKAVENARPLVEVKSRRVGGATYQVPIEVRQDRGTFLAMRWIRDFARETLTRFTFDPLFDQYPVWTPDGLRLLFRSVGPRRPREC